jgi:hypothetical protein
VKVVLCCFWRRAFCFGALKGAGLIENEEKRKVRTKACILLALVIIAMLIPIRHGKDDGGTVTYRAMLYSVTKWNALAVQDHRTGVKTGTTVHILFWDVYDDQQFVPDNIDTVLSPAGGDS